LTADLPELLTCEGLFADHSQRIEAEDSETDVGYIAEDHMMLYSAGYLESAFEVPANGDYTFAISMLGSICEAEYPNWTVSIDEIYVADGTTTDQWLEYSVEAALTEGLHTIRITFDNDCYLPDLNEDRNLGIDYMVLTGTRTFSNCCV